MQTLHHVTLHVHSLSCLYNVVFVRIALIRLQGGQLRILAGVRAVGIFQCLQTSSGVNLASHLIGGSVCEEKQMGCVAFSRLWGTYCYLVPGLRIYGYLPQFLHVPLWYGT